MLQNLLIITQKVDENDDLLGFFVAWLSEFSKHFEKVEVITLATGEYNLPANVSVHSLGKERGNSRLVRFFNFYRLMFHLVPKSDGIFAHMSPIFVIASWPVAFLFRKKIILWYLHRSRTFKLKIANLLCYKIVTASKESLRLKSRKIVEVGHAIDAQRFRVERHWEQLLQASSRILSVGRISEIKDYKTLIEAAKILRDKSIDFEIQIVGKPIMFKDDEYLQSLQLLIANYHLQNAVHLVGFVPYSQLKPYYEVNYLNVNLTPTGGLDKAVLEGMASGQLTLTSNTAFAKYFGKYSDLLIFKHGNSRDLANKIEYLVSLPAKQKEEIADFLLGMVEKEHELGRVIGRISNSF